MVINLKWTRQEIKILKNHYLNKGEEHISNLINKSPNAIRIKATRLGVKRLNRQIKLSSNEKQILLGSLLGDMYCRIRKMCKNAHIEESHSKKQENYLSWKIDNLKSMSFNLRETRLGTMHCESRVYPILKYYHKLFYNHGKKRVNRRILDKLSALGLAVWYMDDGSYSKRDKNSRIYTNGFSYEENVIIQKWFEEKWSFYSKVYSCLKRGKRFYFIAFNVGETKKLIKSIGSHVHKSMKYKMGKLTGGV
jgi:hypothetical protein